MPHSPCGSEAACSPWFSSSILSRKPGLVSLLVSLHEADFGWLPSNMCVVKISMTTDQHPVTWGNPRVVLGVSPCFTSVSPALGTGSWHPVVSPSLAFNSLYPSPPDVIPHFLSSLIWDCSTPSVGRGCLFSPALPFSVSWADPRGLQCHSRSQGDPPPRTGTELGGSGSVTGHSPPSSSPLLLLCSGVWLPPIP